MTDFGSGLKAQLMQFRAAPFLFVGAGISRRYLGLDSWDALLRQLAKLTGQQYDYYLASTEGDLPTVATMIATDLHDPWWHEKRFSNTRAMYDGKLHTRESALKAEASSYLATSMKTRPKSRALTNELRLLRKAVVDGIITTNFDPLMEKLFPDFRVFVGQEELLFEAQQGIGELYKIHGSYEEPDSLVLTRRDFDRFDAQNPYLAAKLMTIFVEHPIIFLGYSMSDDNVASILSAIVSCLKTTERVAKLANRLIFVEWDNAVEEPQIAPSIIPVAGRQIPVVTATVPNYVEVFTVLGTIKRTFPAKLLRQLKEQVAALVLEKDPASRLHVLALDPAQDPREVDVVFGIGAIERLTAYAGLTREDLARDVLDGGDRYDAPRVVQEALPPILARAGNVPIFKYLRAANLLNDAGALLNPDAVDQKVRKHVETREKRLAVLKSQVGWVSKHVKDHPTLDALKDALDWHDVLWAIPGLDSPATADLRQFLAEDTNESYGSQWWKIVCVYDWLTYGPAKEARRSASRKVRVRRRIPKTAS